MATKLGRGRALAQALRPANPSIRVPRNEAAARCFSVTAHTNSYAVKLPKDAKNMRFAEREKLGSLEAPIVNPADKYQSKADNLHRYGSWLMGCLPKYIQQFSVWKDELTIYICPSGVIPVFSFLKCKLPIATPDRGLIASGNAFRSSLANPQFLQTTLLLSLPKSAPSLPSTSLPVISVLKLSTTYCLYDTTAAFASRPMPTRLLPFPPSRACLKGPTGTSARCMI